MMLNAASITDAKQVGVFRGVPCYSARAPFHPDDPPPEYPFSRSPGRVEPNHAYRAVRGALRLAGLDSANRDSARWNPFGEIVQPGDAVVLKPNFVRDFRESDPDHGNCIMTHGAIIRAVLDYVYIALGGRGRIIIADAPQNDADFHAISRITGLQQIKDLYRERVGFEVEVYDLRPERANKIDGVIVGHVPLPGDPAGYVHVNLGTDSAFAEINHLCHLLYGAEYDVRDLHAHHHDDVHEYLISKTVLDADVVISLPKLKTHKKVGLTVNLKNLVGINGNKNWLPHHREGTPAQGGDQYCQDGLKRRFEQAVVVQFKRLFPRLGPLRSRLAGPAKLLGRRVFGDTNTDTIRSGNWYGNDTTWRMVLDLNRILLYADAAGTLHDRPVRRFFSVVDGIIGGEGNGPLDPTPKPAGIVMAGANPVVVDFVCARMMGFDYERLPVLYRALGQHRWPLTHLTATDVVICSNDEQFDGKLAAVRGPALAFEPHFGWRGHVELTRDTHEARPVT